MVLLDGTNPSYINLQQSSGPNSAGLVVPLIGTAGSGTGSSQGLSFEVVFKLTSQLSNFESSKVFSLGQGGLEVIDLGPNTLNGLQTLQLEQQSNIAPGLRSSSYADSFIGQGGLTAGVWYHVV